MIFGPSFGGLGRLSRNASRPVILLSLLIQALPSTSIAALPKRLVIAIDGIAYRDMKALQAGVTYKDTHGFEFHRQGFHQGYFPVSRLISTFPSTSDVAWTDIFGDRPLPGYQRTYFSDAANSEMSVNGITTSMEYEKQMHWDVQNGFLRTLGYVNPSHAYQYDVHELVRNFLNTRSKGDNYYAYLRTPDDAQHLARDVFAILCSLDEKLQELRALYKAREGHDLEILILSDHGNNHAGVGRRIEIQTFLKNAGYRITNSIVNSRDVVLPTTGIESWVEIHNAPAETEKLLQLLPHLKGVDVLTARFPGQTNRFIVMNSKGERAVIEWNPARNSFRYSTGGGDPINYLPVVEALSQKNRLDAGGFATADDWMAETLTHRYPLALERIVRGHTRVTLNPATILISLDNHYVHAGWLIKKGSEFVTFGGTHGALDDLNSDGILLSSFAPTRDTSSSRVARLYDCFPGLRNFRAEGNGAEWITGKEQALTRIARVPLDWDRQMLSDDEVFLRIWTPSFVHLDGEAPVELTVKKSGQYSSAQIGRGEHKLIDASDTYEAVLIGRPGRGDPRPMDASEWHFTLNQPVSFPDQCAYERVYALPADLVLEPQKEYSISGEVRDQNKNIRLFEYTFRTDSRGLPVAY
jgi:Type I phosphodiesterase / nucleotide pyrophosphatase